MYDYAGSGSATSGTESAARLRRELYIYGLALGTAGGLLSLARHAIFAHVPATSSPVEVVWASAPATPAITLPPAAQVREVLAALALNKSQLAQVLRVTRPTLYEWLDEKASPSPANAQRLNLLLRLLASEGVTGSRPLNARFTRSPLEAGEPSLLDLLREQSLDERRVATQVRRARELTEEAWAQREQREERLRQQGFEQLSREERRERLARNIALREWPKG